MACANCFSGGTATGTPTGETTTLYGYKTYIALPPSRTTQSPSTIILYTDAFGLLLPNNPLLADFYAASTGCRVLVPDIIPGGAMSPDCLSLMDKLTTTTVSLFDIGGQLSRAWWFVQAVRMAAPFFWRAKPDYPVCLERCLAYARAVKADLKNDGKGGKLGVAGFCWGGYQATNLGKYASVEGGDEGLVDAHFCAHPSLVKAPGDFVDAVKMWKTPICLAHGTKDMVLSNQAVDETEAILRREVGDGTGENGYYWEFKRYEDCSHGFGVRAQPGNENEGKAAEASREQAVEWFKKFL